MLIPLQLLVLSMIFSETTAQFFGIMLEATICEIEAVPMSAARVDSGRNECIHHKV
jgi:hypothetical protein